MVVLEDEDYNLQEDELEDEIIRVKIGQKGKLSTCHRNPMPKKERNRYDEFRKILGDEAAAEIVNRYKVLNSGNKNQQSMADGIVSNLIHTNRIGRVVLTKVFKMGGGSV